MRNNLKALDFKQLQKSVWVSKQDVVKELRDLIVNLKLEPYVLLIQGQPLLKYKILRKEHF